MSSQKEFFNSVAYNWDHRCKHDMEKVEIILDLLQIQKGSKVLDVGTGTGVLVSSLSKKVSSTGHVKAIDIAENMIDVARMKNQYDNVVFQCEDALENTGDKERYDHIICYSMFPHFPNKQAAIKALASRLKEGGKLSICHSQSRQAINDLHRRVDDIVREDNLPTIEILEKYYQKAGLRIIEKVDNEEMFVVIGKKQNPS